MISFIHQTELVRICSLSFCCVFESLNLCSVHACFKIQLNASIDSETYIVDKEINDSEMKSAEDLIVYVSERRGRLDSKTDVSVMI